MRIYCCDLHVDFFLFGIEVLQFLSHFHDFALDFGVFVAADPFYGIFMQFFDVVNAFEYVGDVIDPPFLYSKELYSLVEVDGAILAVFDELNELFGEY